MDTPEHQSFWACDDCHVVHSMDNDPPETCSVCSAEGFSLVVNVPGAEYTIDVIQEQSDQDQRFGHD